MPLLAGIGIEAGAPKICKCREQAIERQQLNPVQLITYQEQIHNVFDTLEFAFKAAFQRKRFN